MTEIKESLHRSKLTNYRKQCASRLNGLVLDCGGGLGGYIPFFHGQVVVLDINLEVLERLSHPAKVMADAANLPFADNCFDAVWACAICQYLELERFICEALRVTRPAGEIWILVPNASSPWDRIKKLLKMQTWREQEGIIKQYMVDDLKKYGKVTGEIQFIPFEFLFRRWPRLGHTLMLQITKEEL